MSLRGPETGNRRSILGIVFLTLFIDLIGFSIIFPLYPSMLEYYVGLEGDSGLLGMMMRGIDAFQQTLGIEGASRIVLFGGILASIYSLLQFVCAPVFGALSDRFGRRPVLIVSIAGTTLSYLVWVFAGSFTVLVISRLIGGVMSGNISTASAAIADVTSDRHRTKGMALIGIAFGVGFVVGPILGTTGLIDLTRHAPGLREWGLNPFSMAAITALIFSLANLLFVVLRFPETRRARAETPERPRRPINPVHLFRTEAYPGVTRTNVANFLFLCVFAGLEFTITFLALERFGFGPKGNAGMLAFIGILSALIQGTYVRWRSEILGPRTLAWHGLLFLIPGLALIGYAPNVAVLYLGLFVMAVGAAQVLPSFISMVSLYSPPEEQGRIMGVFRSLGALARVVGPFWASIVYWQLGSRHAYYAFAIMGIVPLVMVRLLPEPARKVEDIGPTPVPSEGM